MPHQCAVCVSDQRQKAEAMHVLGGRSIASISRELGLPYQATKRHIRHHFQSSKQVTKPPRRRQAAATGSAASDTFRAAFGMDPMEHQVEYLESGDPTIMLKGRQIGMTQAGAALAIHVARQTPGADAVIISPSQRQSSEVTVRARLGLWELGEKLVQDSAGLLRLANGSRIISLPGNSRGVRGYAPALVIVDEAAWVADDTWTAVRPLVAASGGRLIVQSTPGHPTGWFYELATAPPEGWLYMRVRSDEVPTVSAEFLERERREMSPSLFAQEYMAEFPSAASVGSLWTEDEWRALIRTPEQEEAR